MTRETITMSQQEVDRLQITQSVVGKHLKQWEAADRLGVSECSSGQTVGAALSGRGSGGAGVRSPGSASQ